MLRMIRSPRIPQELIDYTIDFHHNSREDLHCLALVSKACLSSARHHLFRTIYVTPNTSGPRNLTAFSTLLKAGPSLSLAVSDLHFRRIGPLHVDDDEVSFSTIVTAIRIFKRLQILEVFYSLIPDDLNGYPELVEPAASSRSFHTLRIVGCTFSTLTWHPIIRLIREFRTLSLLALIDSDHQSQQVDEDKSGPKANELTLSPSGSKIQIHTLHIQGLVYDGESLIAVLSRALRLEEVEVLDIGCGCVARGFHTALIQAASSALTGVYVTNDLDFDDLEGLAALRIAKPDCSDSLAVRTVGLSFGPTLYLLDTVEIIPDFIRSLLASPTAETLILEFTVGFSDVFDDETEVENILREVAEWKILWESLGDYIRQRLPALSYVDVSFSHGFREDWKEPEKMYEALKEVLPSEAELEIVRLYKRGLQGFS